MSFVIFFSFSEIVQLVKEAKAGDKKKTHKQNAANAAQIMEQRRDVGGDEIEFGLGWRWFVPCVAAFSLKSILGVSTPATRL